MRLYLKGTLLSVKLTLKAAALPVATLLLCLLVAFLLFGGVAPAPAPLRLGLLCLDDHPLLPLLTAAVTDSPEAQALAELTLLSPNEPTQGFDLVITLPPGFVQSILTGENLSPTVELGRTGLSSIYIRELCTAAERYLSCAQAGIYATLESLPPLAPAQYNAALTAINLRYVTLFLNRLALLSREYGRVDSFYLLRSALAVLLCLLGGCLGSTLTRLLPVARGMRNVPGSGGALFTAGVSGIFLVCLPLLPPCLFLAFGQRMTLQPLPLLALAALLTALSCFFFALAGGNGGTAALLLCGFTLPAALLGGALLPLELLPEFFTRIAPLSPVYQLRALVSLLSGGYGLELPGGVLPHLVLWLGGAALCWNRNIRLENRALAEGGQ